MNAPAVTPHPRPTGPVVMHQRWRRLLFLHWSWDARAVQATLPPELTVDSWDGRAWLGIVPFAMRRVRPRFCPPVGWLSDFLELNVRTYVRDARGRPGVWFYSLDCAQPVAVWAARTFFRLPYFRADMREERTAGEIRYYCRRVGQDAEARYVYQPAGMAAPASSESIEAFLVERYRLFAGGAGAPLFTGEVWHPPYEIQPVETSQWDATPLRQAGFDPGDRPPEHAAFAPGVDVRIFPLRRA